MRYHVLGLNESSTEYDMKKYYRNMACRFYPDDNKYLQDSDVMLMINKAKEEFEDTLRYNDAMREQECFRMAQNYIDFFSDSSSSSSSDDSLETLSDDSSDSGKRQNPTKPVTSSNKLSTFTAKHKPDNEESTLKKNHQDAFTPKT